MRDVFTGILAGLGQAHQEHTDQLMQMEMQRRSQMADFWKQQASDPNVRPEARDVAVQKYMGIVQQPHDKKLPKQFESMDDFLNVTPKQGQSLQTPAPQSIPAPGAPFVPYQSAPAPMPTPPPDYSPVPARYTEQEKLASARRAGDLESEMAGNKAGAEERAKLGALYSPENLKALIESEQAKKGPVIVPRGATAYDSAGKVIGRGSPVPRTPDQIMLDAAAKKVMLAHGMQLPAPDLNDNGEGLFGTLPPSLQAEAAREHAMMKETPDIAETRKLTQQRDQLLNQETQLRINDLLKENDPESYSKIADLVHDNPDALFNYAPKEMKKISDTMLAKGYPVPRKPLPATQQTQVSNADLVLQHTSAIRDLIRRYPDVIGPVAGRVGLSEEDWGAPVFDARNDPEKAAAEQEIRTRMKYLIAQDLRALIGTRPPAAWMTELKKSSPNPAMARSFLEGSLRGVEGSANLVLDAAYRARYGTQPTATGRTATAYGAGAPQPPPGTTPPPAPTQKMATSQDVQAYATANKIPLAQAQAQFRQSGYTIIPKMK